MFNSLQKRIILAFGLVIFFAILLSGWLSIRATTNEFDTFVSEEGFQQAADIAVFLEASYNYQGHLNDIEQLLMQQYGFADVPLDGVFIEEFSADGNILIEDENGELIPLDVVEEYYPYEDWDRLFADLLDLSMAGYNEQRAEYSIAEMADAEGVPVRDLVAAAMLIERQQLPEFMEFEEDAVFYLSDTLYWVQDYVIAPPFDEQFYLNESGFFFDTLFDDSRILMGNPDGEIIFDSMDGEMVGDELSDEQLWQGVNIQDWETGELVATVVVVSGAGFFREREQIFINNAIRSLIISGGIATLAALVVGWLMARQISAPVTALTQAATRLAEGDNSERLPIQSSDELGGMSRAFNTLADALDRQHTLRTQLVADVSHELNTPLSVIQLEMEALRDGIQPPDDAVEQVLQEINLLRNLTQDLTLLADRDQGVLSLSLEPLDWSEFIPRAVTRWQSKAEAAGVELRIRPPLLQGATTPHTLQADPVRLNQVLGNLIRNALQHTPSGGRIDISCAYRSAPNLPGEWLVITVRDTGSGIAAEHLPFIFERFYKADASRQREGRGRGLGLAIVQDIIELHGGHVWVESVLDEGCAFSFALR